MSLAEEIFNALVDCTLDAGKYLQSKFPRGYRFAIIAFHPSDVQWHMISTTMSLREIREGLSALEDHPDYTEDRTYAPEPKTDHELN